MQQLFFLYVVFLEAWLWRAALVLNGFRTHTRSLDIPHLALQWFLVVAALGRTRPPHGLAWSLAVARSYWTPQWFGELSILMLCDLCHMVSALIF